MALSNIQKELLESISDKLMYGDMKSIAEKTRKTENYVSMVLNPASDFFNMKIVEAAAAIISARELKTKGLLEKITA